MHHLVEARAFLPVGLKPALQTRPSLGSLDSLPLKLTLPKLSSLRRGSYPFLAANLVRQGVPNWCFRHPRKGLYQGGTR